MKNYGHDLSANRMLFLLFNKMSVNEYGKELFYILQSQFNQRKKDDSGVFCPILSKFLSLSKYIVDR